MKPIFVFLLISILCSCNSPEKDKIYSSDQPLLPKGQYTINSNTDEYTAKDKRLLSFAGIDLVALTGIKSSQGSQVKDGYYLNSHGSFVFSVVTDRIETPNKQNKKRTTIQNKYKSHKIHSPCGIQGGKSCQIDENAKWHNNSNYVSILRDKRASQYMGTDSALFIINNELTDIGIKGQINSTRATSFKNETIRQNYPVILCSGSANDGDKKYDWLIGYIEYDLSYKYDFDSYFQDPIFESMTFTGGGTFQGDRMPSLLMFVDKYASN